MMWMAIAAYLQGRGRRQGAALLVHSATAYLEPKLYLQSSAKVPLLRKLSRAHPRPTPAALCSCVLLHHQGCVASQLLSQRQVDTRDRVRPRHCQALITVVLVKVQCKCMS